MSNRAAIVGASIVCFVGLAVPAPARDAGWVSIELSGESGVFASGPHTPLQSAVAELEDLGEGCRVFTFCLSSLPGVDCKRTKSVEVPDGAFVLVIGVRLAQDKSPDAGRWTDIGVILRGGGARYYAHGNMGAVVLRDVSGPVRGDLEIDNADLKVSGHFSAMLRQSGEPAKPPAVGAAEK